MEPYKEFLEKFQEIDANKLDTQISFVMRYLQDLGNGKKFDEFQSILDNAEPEKFNDGAFTIGLVSWWYGSKVDRKGYLEKAIKHYISTIGEERTQRLFNGIMEGKWEPQFGFERNMFGIKE